MWKSPTCLWKSLKWNMSEPWVPWRPRMSHESRHTDEQAADTAGRVWKFLRWVSFASLYWVNFWRTQISFDERAIEQVAPTNEWRCAHERAMCHVTRTNKQLHKSLLTNEPWITSHPRTSYESRHSHVSRTLSFSTSSSKYRAMNHVTPTNKQLIQQLSFESLFAGLFCRSLLTYINLVWQASYESRHTHQKAANPEATSSVGLFRRSLLSQILTYVNLVWWAGHVWHPRTSS